MEANLDLPAMKDKEMLPASSANLKQEHAPYPKEEASAKW